MMTISELRKECPLCAGVSVTQDCVHCHECKGAGWVWIQNPGEMAERIERLEAELAEAKEETAKHWSALTRAITDGQEQYQRLETERDELLSHRLNNDPTKVAWRAAKTVGELRMQLETIDPAMKVAAVYFVKIGDRTVARALGISLSLERLNFEKNVVDQRNKEVPYGLALWTHENDGFGPEVLSYLRRAEILATARAAAEGLEP